MPRNKLTDMHNILMEQLERLNDEDLSDEELQTEIKRSKAMAGLSAEIIDNARVHIEAAQFQDVLDSIIKPLRIPCKKAMKRIRKSMKMFFREMSYKKTRLPRKLKKKYKKLGIYDQWKEENL